MWYSNTFMQFVFLGRGWAARWLGLYPQNPHWKPKGSLHLAMPKTIPLEWHYTPALAHVIILKSARTDWYTRAGRERERLKNGQIHWQRGRPVDSKIHSERQNEALGCWGLPYVLAKRWDTGVFHRGIRRHTSLKDRKLTLSLRPFLSSN